MTRAHWWNGIPRLFLQVVSFSFSSGGGLQLLDSGGWTRTHVLVPLEVWMPAPPRRKPLQLYVQWNILLRWAHRHVTGDRAWGMHPNGAGYAYGACFTLVMFFSFIRDGHVWRESITESLPQSGLAGHWGFGVFLSPPPMFLYCSPVTF